MNADHITPQLAPFHLGTLDDPEVESIEVHLGECRACLGEYLALKRRFDRSVPLDERPATRVRAEIRRQVARRLPLAFTPRTRLLAMGGAAIAAALLIALFLARHPRSASSSTSPPSSSASPLIDSAATSPLL